MAKSSAWRGDDFEVDGGERAVADSNQPGSRRDLNGLDGGRTAGGHRRCPGRGDACVATLRRVTGDALVVAVPVEGFGAVSPMVVLVAAAALAAAAPRRSTTGDDWWMVDRQ
ncbi:hypothetical protein Dimus_031790 [Dionaea muscipula]